MCSTCPSTSFRPGEPACRTGRSPSETGYAVLFSILDLGVCSRDRHGQQEARRFRVWLLPVLCLRGVNQRTGLLEPAGLLTGGPADADAAGHNELLDVRGPTGVHRYDTRPLLRLHIPLCRTMLGITGECVVTQYPADGVGQLQSRHLSEVGGLGATIGARFAGVNQV